MTGLGKILLKNNFIEQNLTKLYYERFICKPATKVISIDADTFAMSVCDMTKHSEIAQSYKGKLESLRDYANSWADLDSNFMLLYDDVRRVSKSYARNDFCKMIKTNKAEITEKSEKALRDVASYLAGSKRVPEEEQQIFAQNMADSWLINDEMRELIRGRGNKFFNKVLNTLGF